jgi:hypothetical protein
MIRVPKCVPGRGEVSNGFCELLEELKYTL